MATGLGASGRGATMAPPDLPDAGAIEWSRVGGMSPRSPIVGYSGGSRPGVDPGFQRERMQTLPAGGPASGGTMVGPEAKHLDDWRDIINFRHSPMPWLLVASLIVVGLLQLRLSAGISAGR